LDITRELLKGGRQQCDSRVSHLGALLLNLVGSALSRVKAGVYVHQVINQSGTALITPLSKFDRGVFIYQKISRR